jgi:maleylacetoacetate isomerase/maleylpyruvate isomerase
MKLYGYYRSSTTYRVRIALNLKGIAFETVPVNLLTGEHREGPYAAVNPHGRVPALRLDDGTTLSQSPAILEYLDEAYPDPPLLPVDPLGRARVREVTALIACDMHPLNNSGVLAYLKGPLGQEQAAVDAWFLHWMEAGLRSVERLLRPGPFALGDRPTLADLLLVPQIFNARRFAVPLDAYPKILAVEAACAELPAFRDAAPGLQPDAPPEQRPAG